MARRPRIFRQMIGSGGAAASVCPQNRAYGSVHGSSRKAYPLIYLKPMRSTGLGDLHPSHR
jgi:hypothetical protein